MVEKIDSFFGQYRFLSNFYIEPDGSHVEGEYQASKTNPPSDYIKRLPPNKAKAEGKRLKLRQDWEAIKYSIMVQLVLNKFQDHATLKHLLKSTGRAILIEGNKWGDTYWGVCNGVGQNNLGKILMEVRSLI